MSTAPKLLFVHVGLHKTGTTYLQNVMRANRDTLRDGGVDFPDREGAVVQRRSAFELLGHRSRGYNDPRIDGAWDALVAAIDQRDLPTAVISEEMLCWATRKQAQRLVASFPSREVHVVVTARDLGRVLVSAWQQYLRDDTTWTWREYADAVRDPDLVDVNPARAFWGTQDLPGICATWAEAVGPARVHVVTVPAPGGPRDELLRRFAAVIGFDPGRMTAEAPFANENIGVVGAEVIRQLNLRMDNRLNRPEHGKVVERTIAPMLAARADAAGATLPREDVTWAGARAELMITAVAAAGYPVTGDLDDLRVTYRAGRSPDGATPQEVLEAALDVLAQLAERYATSWWAQQQQKVEAEQPRTSLAFKARGLAVAGRRRIGKVVQASPLLLKTVAALRRTRNRLKGAR